jgi:hypothetical protein
MSHVTDIILTCSLCDEEGGSDAYPAVEFLNLWMERAGHGRFVDVSEHAGGHKNLQAPVFLCAANFLDIEEFLRAVAAAPWDRPESVRVLLQQEHGDGFELHEVPFRGSAPENKP